MLKATVSLLALLAAGGPPAMAQKAPAQPFVLAYSSGENAGSSSRGVAGSGGNSSGSNTNVHEIGRDLIQPAELIHKMRRDEQILITPGSDPMRLGRAISFRRADMATQEEHDGLDELHAKFSSSQPGSAARADAARVAAGSRAAISGA